MKKSDLKKLIKGILVEEMADNDKHTLYAAYTTDDGEYYSRFGTATDKDSFKRRINNSKFVKEYEIREFPKQNPNKYLRNFLLSVIDSAAYKGGDVSKRMNKAIETEEKYWNGVSYDNYDYDRLSHLGTTAFIELLKDKAKDALYDALYQDKAVTDFIKTLTDVDLKKMDEDLLYEWSVNA